MMNAITIRNLSEEQSRKLEELAAANGTTAQVEAERLLDAALAELTEAGTDIEEPVAQITGQGLFDALQQLGRDFPELQEIDFSREQTPARTVDFG